MVDLIFVSIANIISVALEFLVDSLLPFLSFDFKTFATTFPYAADAFVIFQRIAIGLILLIGVAQLLFFFLGKEQNRPSPMRVVLHTLLAVGGVYYGNYLFEGIMQIAQLPYDALLNTDVVATADISVLVWVVNDAFYGVSPFLYIIVLVMIGLAFVKLLLEAIERYVVLFGLLYLSPLAAAMLASDTTSGIFKRFFTMFLSQCLLLILNVWSLQMTLSLFRSLWSSAEPVFTLLIGYAFLRFASRIDSYLNSLGLNAAVTGAGLGAELMGTGMALMAGISALGGGKKFLAGVGGGANGAANNVLGEAVNGVSGFAEKYSPVAGISHAASEKAGAVAKTFGQSLGQAGDAAVGADQGSRMNAAKDAFQNAWNENYRPNMDAADIQAGHNVFFRPGVIGNYQVGYHSMSSPQVQRAVESNAYLADQAFNTNPEGSGIYDSSQVSSIASGIGADQLGPDAQEAIAVGNGLLPAENLDFSKTENGLHMGYSKDGMNKSLDIKNSTQLAALSPEEQALYTSFNSKDGHKYYARQNTVRSPSEMQKKQETIKAELGAFTTNPSTQLSPESANALRKDPNQLSATYQNMRTNGTRLTGDTPEGQKAISQLLSVTPTDNKLNDGKQLAMANLNNGTATGAYADGNGIHVPWKDSGGNPHVFDVVAPGADSASAAGDPSYKPYSLGNSDSTLARYTDPTTAAAKEARIFEKASSIGSGNALTQDEWNHLHSLSPAKRMDFQNRVFENLQNSGQTISINEANQRELANLVKLGSYDGISRSQQAQIATQLASADIGDVEMVISGRGFYVNTEAAGSVHVATGPAIADPTSDRERDSSGKIIKDPATLANNGYTWSNSGGRDYYSTFIPHSKDNSNIDKHMV